jgi:hypothetical protein
MGMKILGTQGSGTFAAMLIKRVQYLTLSVASAAFEKTLD